MDIVDRLNNPPGWAVESPQDWFREAAAEIERLRAAGRKALNYIENTEGELGITLDCGDALRAALSLSPSQETKGDYILDAPRGLG